MLNLQDKQLRNLQEQVQKNKEDIANHYNMDRVIADFGIRVIGQLLEAPEKPYPQESYNYGDAYAVGIEAPYEFYIWTRADINSGHPEDYFLNIGHLAIVGPQGPVGPEGPKGPQGQSSKWRAFNYNPILNDTTGFNINDMWLNAASGDVFKVNESENWEKVGNIKGPQGNQGNTGPQGPQGPQGVKGDKGDTGDVGGFINIAGKIDSPNLLPDPATLKDLTKAYLVGSENHLYIQVGSTSATAVWMDMGLLNVATYVTVNGNYQNTWNADTKLDKVTTTDTKDRLYGVKANGTQSLEKIETGATPNTIAKRNGNGVLTSALSMKSPSGYNNYDVLITADLTVPDMIHAQSSGERYDIYSNKTYYAPTEQYDGEIILAFFINAFSDVNPQWQFTFEAGTNVELTFGTNPVLYLNGMEPTFTQGNIYTVIAFPAFYSDLNDLQRGDVFRGTLCVAVLEFA